MKSALAQLSLATVFVLSVSSFRTADAGTLLVSNTGDSGPGSLRQALLDNGTTGGGNTVIFSNVVTGTIRLNTGELLISNNVTILGPGAKVLFVDGNAASRVFHITNAVTAVISGLTITNGAVSGAFPGFYGAGIWNDHSSLTLSNCIITSNTVVAGSAGGVFNDGSSGIAKLSIIASTFSGNVGNSGGGGIFNYAPGGTADISINASTFSGNRGGSGAGGGIFNSGAGGLTTITASNSTFSGNWSTVNGAGVANNAFSGTGIVTAVACTFSANTAISFGGGIYNNGGSTGNALLTVIGCTFSDNSAPANSGGSICNISSAARLDTARLEIGDTILKPGLSGGNFVNNGLVTSDGYNLSSDNALGVLTNATDQLNTDPMLGPLADNGGPTLTHALVFGSPAVDKGRSFGLTMDQRGAPRPFKFTVTTNATGGDGSDIGAFELGGPKLDIQETGSSVVLSWPSSYTGFSLQSSTNLASSNGWSPAGGSAAVVGSQYQQTNGPISSNLFFRLHEN